MRGGDGDRPAPPRPAAAKPAALAEAAALGLAALAGVVVGAEDGIAVIDPARRFVYTNPAGCELFGYTLEELRGRDFLSSIPVREHAMMATRFTDQLTAPLEEVPGPFTCCLIGPDGAEREIVYSRFAVDGTGGPADVAIFRDLTGPRAAARAAVALAQTAAQVVGTAGVAHILTSIARHAVEGTRAVYCSIALMNEEHQPVAHGGFGVRPDGPAEAEPFWSTVSDGAIVDEVMAVMTGGSIALGDAPRPPVVVPNARTSWGTSPVMKELAHALHGLRWQGAVCVPLSWMDRVFGLFLVLVPAGVPGPSDEELAFYTALADQAAVVLINSRLNAQARQAATVSERARLARELHDSVSQGLFSMTMHARAAQMSMARAGLAEDGPLGRSIAELAELTQGALAEMRALIFELRPAALAEEGLVAALRKQAAALAAREQLAVSVDGPAQRLALNDDVEEHVYRIASEALHNVINHPGASRMEITIIDGADQLRLEVHDDGAGLVPDGAHAGHPEISTMLERAASVGGRLDIFSESGTGTTLVLSVPTGEPGARRRPVPDRAREQATVQDGRRLTTPDAFPVPVRSETTATASQGGTREEPASAASALGNTSTFADAVALGLPTLTAVLAGAQEGIVISNATQRFVYVNPAACRMFGRPSEELRGRHFLSVIPAREHEFRLSRFSELRSGAPARYSGTLLDCDGGEHEAVYSTFPTEIAGSPHTVAFIRDVTGARTAARTAMALAQTASQLIEAGTTAGEVLANICRHAVDGDRVMASGISAIDDDEQQTWVHGGYGPQGPTFGDDRADGWIALEKIPVSQRVAALTGGSIVIGEIAGTPVVLTDAHSVWARNPLLGEWVTTMGAWRGTAVFVPLSWDSRVFGWLSVFLSPGLGAPSEEELAFFTALADQAAVAVTNAGLTSRARRTATLLERWRLARELHDSVSQAVFSMTLHARAAQLAMVKADVDDSGPLGRAVSELDDLSRGVMAEMRALIFELRPAALAEQGLVAALHQQAAALSARDRTAVTSQGPEERLDLPAEVEEHVYRIVTEALHNVINHAGADSASVRVSQEPGGLRVEVRDDGAGFDPARARPGHLGLSTMADRADAIGAALSVNSVPGMGTQVVLTLARHGQPRSRGIADE